VHLERLEAHGLELGLPFSHRGQVARTGSYSRDTSL
jgi:hypothetical protein